MAQTKSRSLSLFGAGLATVVLVAIVTIAIALIVMGRALLPQDLRGQIEERCTAEVDSHSGTLDIEQAENASLIASIARQRGLPARAVTIGLATAMQESGIRNLDYGDRDSLGMFQQRPSQGWGTEAQVQDPAYATGIFFDHLVRVPDYQSMPITEAAQAVQRSAYPDAYAQHEDMARAFASALSGVAPASLTCVLQPAEPGAQAAPLLAAIKKAVPGARITQSTGPTDEPIVRVALPRAKDRDAASWAFAEWALVHAKRYGVTDVLVADQLWRRDTGTWQGSTRDRPGAGTVQITLSAPADDGPSPSP